MTERRQSLHGGDRRRWFLQYPRITALGIGVLLLVLLIGTSELALRASTPAWLRARMQIRADLGSMNLGSDAATAVVRRAGRPLSYKPGAHLSLVHSEYSTSAKIDELGGRAFSNRSPGRPLVPILGDSFTFGLGVNDDEAFVALLQPSFAERVVNLGMIGASLPHYRFVIEQRHEELGRPPAYVICVFLGNDLNDLIRLAEESSRATTSHAQRQSGAAFRRWNQVLEMSWVGDLYSFQSLKRLALPVINRWRREPLLDPIFPLMGSEPAYVTRAFQLFDAEVEKLAAVARAHGTSLLFVFIPDCHQVVAERRVQKAAYYSISASKLDPMAPNRGAAAILDAHGLRYVDPTSEILSSSDNDAFYYHYDTHLTAAGHAFLARVLSAQLPAQVAGLTNPSTDDRQ